MTIPPRLYADARFTGPPPELAAFTTNVTVVLCCNVPEVPVMVTVYVFPGVDPVVTRLIADVPAALSDAGLKLAVVPAGKPLALNVTVPVNPFSAPTVAV